MGKGFGAPPQNEADTFGPEHDFVDKLDVWGKIPVLMRTRNRSGFTLIELLIVIVIIGILVSMSIAGFGWWAETQDKKTAQSQVEALQLALEQYKSELGGFPKTDLLANSDDEEVRAILLFRCLTGFLDRFGEDVDVDRRGKSFLPNKDNFVLGSREEGDLRLVTLSLEQMRGAQPPEVFLVDPWNNPYVYEFPRRDGHKGFLLFSKGPDGQASEFDSELTQTPKKEDTDIDNFPPSEPGKW